jgi:hypothetical protein
MTSAIRRDALRVLEELGQLYPEMRLGQLVVMIANLTGEDSPKEVYDLEDEELVASARQHLERRTKSLAD